MECGICFEAYSEERLPKILPCGHSFCLPCLQQQRECPMDRKVYGVAPADLLTCFQLLSFSQIATPSPRVPRVWCRSCCADAKEACVEEKHPICGVSKARSEDSAQLVATLQGGVLALELLDRVLEDGAASLGGQVAHRCAELQRTRVLCAEARARLEAAVGADDAAWQQSRDAATGEAQGLSQRAARLADLLVDPEASLLVRVQRDGEEGGGVAWSGRLRGGLRAAAAVLLCQALEAEGAEPGGEASPGSGLKGAEAADDCGAATANNEPRAERSVEMTAEEVAAELAVGCKVRRGRDWGSRGPGGVRPAQKSLGPCQDVDGVDATCMRWTGVGVVVASAAGKVEVQWTSGKRFWYFVGSVACQVEPTRGNCYWPPADLHPIWSDGVDLHSSSTDPGSTAPAETLSQATKVKGLHCDASWSSAALRSMAPRVEWLDLVSPRREHMLVVRDMPKLSWLRLRGAPLEDGTLPVRVGPLSIASVTRQQLQQVSLLPKLKELSVHCPSDAPLPGVAFPEAVAPINWLETGLHPLSTALALVRAHAATLQTLWLVAGSLDPYGCPDLAGELRQCGLRSLTELRLLRYTATGRPCRHVKEECDRQKRELRDMFLETGVKVNVYCSEVD